MVINSNYNPYTSDPQHIGYESIGQAKESKIVTFVSLLDEITNLRSLAEYPNPAYTSLCRYVKEFDLGLFDLKAGENIVKIENLIVEGYQANLFALDYFKILAAE